MSRRNRNPKHTIADVKNKKSENKFQSVSAKCLMIEVHSKFQYKLTRWYEYILQITILFFFVFL